MHDGRYKNAGTTAKRSRTKPPPKKTKRKRHWIQKRNFDITLGIVVVVLVVVPMFVRVAVLALQLAAFVSGNTCPRPKLGAQECQESDNANADVGGSGTTAHGFRPPALPPLLPASSVHSAPKSNCAAAVSSCSRVMVLEPEIDNLEALLLHDVHPVHV